MGLAEENQDPDVHGSQGQPVGTAQILNWKEQNLSKGEMQQFLLLHNPLSHPKPTLETQTLPAPKIQVTHPNRQQGIFLRGVLHIPTTLTIPTASGRPKAENKCYWIQARHKTHQELPVRSAGGPAGHCTHEDQKGTPQDLPFPFQMVV